MLHAAWDLNDEVEQLEESKKWSRKALRSELRRRLGWRSKKEDLSYQTKTDAQVPSLHSDSAGGVPQHADGSGGGGRVRGSRTNTTAPVRVARSVKSSIWPRGEHEHEHGSPPKSSQWFARRSRRQRSEPSLSTSAG